MSVKICCRRWNLPIELQEIRIQARPSRGAVSVLLLVLAVCRNDWRWCRTLNGSIVDSLLSLMMWRHVASFVFENRQLAYIIQNAFIRLNPKAALYAELRSPAEKRIPTADSTLIFIWSFNLQSLNWPPIQHVLVPSLPAILRYFYYRSSNKFALLNSGF